MINNLIQQARKADLAKYLISVGEPLIRNGHRYRHKEHDSLIFTKNAYFWNSRQEHGNSIDYLTRHKNMSFAQAVTALTDCTSFDVGADRDAPQLSRLEISKDYSRAIAYLNKTRNIDYAIIRNLINTKHIYQEQTTNNIIFPMYDEHNAYVGAEFQGTLSNKRFKGIKSGSKFGYGFNIRFGDTFDYALFFESGVDLLSFIDIRRNHNDKSLQNCILVSMAGLKANIIQHTLEAFTGDLRAVLCVDNDNAGLEFKNAVKRQIKDITTFQPDTHFKDWNDQLKSLYGH